jgi:hypothetical protein
MQRYTLDTVELTLYNFGAEAPELDNKKPAPGINPGGLVDYKRK